MKNLLKLVALALFTVALTVAAAAQDTAHIVRANIPFNFYAGGQLLPAGEYTILVNAEDHVVTIAEKATGHRSTLLGSPHDGSSDYRIVLRFRLADSEVYALRELQGPDLGVSFNAREPRLAARAQSQKPQSVEVIAEAR